MAGQRLICWPTLKSTILKHPANTRHPPDVRPMMVHRLRRWPNISPTLGGCLLFAREGPFFQVSDILYTGIEIKHDIICRYDSYHTK